MATATAEKLLTVEEFLAKYGHCSGVELVRGRVVWPGREAEPPSGSHMPKFRHGVVSYRATRLLSDFIEANQLGWVAINDTFVRTGQDPATVWGADLLYISYSKLPDGSEPDDLTIPPDLVVEVRSPTDLWTDVIGKTIEYLRAGVPVVVVLDPKTESATTFRDDVGQTIFETGDDFTLPDVLPGFSVPVAKFFRK